MKAAVCTNYGPPEVVEIREVPQPVPKANELLVRVHATTVSSGDARIRGADFPLGMSLLAKSMFGFIKPRQPIFGSGYAGTVEAIGADVTKFSVGDRVFGERGFELATHAEYCCIGEDDSVVTMPANIGFEKAAAVTFGTPTSLMYLRDLGDIQSGQSVLINGASGCLGTAGVQLAKHFGAEVTGVCSTQNVQLVKSLGADQVIDYTQEDFTKNGLRYDFIYSTLGKVNLSQCWSSLKSDGVFLSAVASLPRLLYSKLIAMFSRRQIKDGVANPTKEDFQLFKELCEEGKLTPVIDRTFPLEQIVEAYRLVDSGHKKGSVVIKIA